MYEKHYPLPTLRTDGRSLCFQRLTSAAVVSRPLQATFRFDFIRLAFWEQQANLQQI